MNKTIFLLRGVNVGGKNLLPMKELAALLEQAGFREVRTYIQSGNIIFKADYPSATSFTGLIKEKFGFSPQTIMLSAKEFKTSIDNNPFDTENGKLTHFYFCEDTPNLDINKLNGYKAKSEQVKLVDKVFYLYAPEGIGRSKLVSKIEFCLGVKATGRNLNTIRKLADILEDD